MRIIGLDYGERRIGVAVGDPTGTIASPQGAIAVRKDGSHIGEIAALCESLGAERIVVGLPLHLSGAEGASAQAARALAERLQSGVAIPVVLMDERLTTAQAERALLSWDVSRAKRKRVIDGVSAALLLDAYLGRLRGEKQDRDEGNPGARGEG